MLERLKKFLSESRVAYVLKTYELIHGSLLAKGLSFSLIVAAVPLLFLLFTISSFVLNPEIIEILDNVLYGFLPTDQRADLLEGVQRYAREESSLSLITGFLFLLAVNNLFFDLSRVIAAGLGIRRGVARGRLAALLAPLALVGVLYGATLLSGAGRWLADAVGLTPTTFRVVTLVVSTLLIGIVILLLYRWIGGRRLKLLPTAIVSLAAGVIWQGILFVAGLTVRIAGTRFVAYGILAWAVVFLIFMRVVADILLYGAIILSHYMRKRGSTQHERAGRAEPGAL
ncbi:MAG: YhjD/YihY/BrkB family envelope integrity protein [Spirochaetales bacterium]